MPTVNSKPIDTSWMNKREDSDSPKARGKAVSVIPSSQAPKKDEGDDFKNNLAAMLARGPRQPAKTQASNPI